jgi:hypothetical protein
MFMNQIKKYVLTMWLVVSGSLCYAQALATDTVKREVKITYQQEENKVSFSTITPPLQQMQGAPTAFYTFHWEFGDGQYSTEPNPVHTYKKNGEHTVKVWTTNNYDNGKPPPARPKKISVKKIASFEGDKTLSIPDAFQLKNNCSAVPEQEMVVVMSYENQQKYTINGKLYLFYNEKKYKADNFELTEIRTHNNEREVADDALAKLTFHTKPNPYTLLASIDPMIIYPQQKDLMINTSKALEESRVYYRNLKVLEFNDMPAYETRNIFFSLRTTPEMLKDTSALITIRGIYVPERGKDGHKSKTLEMEIVTSHDPNKMSVADSKLNYRFYKKKDMRFKIRFQNNGEGPARSIKLLVDVPPSYEMRSLNVGEMYPACPICPEEPVAYSCLDTIYTNSQLIFHFKKIYLPGSNQKNISERDSTKGYVRYTLKYKEKVEKEASLSRTAIVFDKNEPVITNYVSTRFKPGLSIGAMIGSGYFTERTDYRNYWAGATFSPYKAAKGYWQSELHLGSLAYADSSFSEIIRPLDGSLNLQNFIQVSQEDVRNKFLAHIVPISYRYSITKWLGIGMGVRLDVTLTEKVKTTAFNKHYVSDIRQGFRERRVDLDQTLRTEDELSFNRLSGAVFSDIVLGSARIGPAVGVRYLYQLEAPYQQWQFYLIWKF